MKFVHEHCSEGEDALWNALLRGYTIIIGFHHLPGCDCICGRGTMPCSTRVSEYSRTLEMESALESAFAVGDQRQKIERYEEILFAVISSSDVIEAKKFIDHMLSDEVALVVSRQLLNSLA